MENPVCEGTWEELAAHADQFKGQRLRVMVLPPKGKEETDESRLRETVACLFEEADSLEREPGKQSSDPYEAAFGEIITEKYRKMGLKL